MFISLGVKFEANVEALNMVETAGNYSKHRRVPYIIGSKDTLKIIYVPAISGESIAHAYQELLAEEAINEKQKVCSLCARGEFLKSMDEKRAKEKFEDKKLPNKPEEIEKGIVENCTVEDVGGFLYAGNPPVKRSSAFQVSYALPIKKIAIYSTVEPQLHARHAQMPEVIQNKVKEGAAEQMIYYVETGTSIYGFILNLDLNAISKSALTGELIIPDYAVKSRRKAAVKALVRMLSSGQFGAKLSRFLPNGSIISLAVSITEKPFVVTSPIYDEFEDNTLRRLDKLSKEFNEKCAFYVMGKDEFKTPEDVLTEVVNYLKNNNII